MILLVISGSQTRAGISSSSEGRKDARKERKAARQREPSENEGHEAAVGRY